jgi:hypothetical protein
MQLGLNVDQFGFLFATGLVSDEDIATGWGVVIASIEKRCVASALLLKSKYLIGYFLQVFFFDSWIRKTVTLKSPIEFNCLQVQFKIINYKISKLFFRSKPIRHGNFLYDT